MAAVAVASSGLALAQDAPSPWPDNPYCAALWDRVATAWEAERGDDLPSFAVPAPGYAGAGGRGSFPAVRLTGIRSKEAEGTVFVSVVVNEEGKPECPRVPGETAPERGAAITATMRL